MRSTIDRLAFVAVLLLISATAAASDYPLSEILPAEASGKLSKAGIQHTGDLLQKAARRADRKKLAKTSGLAAKQLTAWVKMADLLRIKGLGPLMAKFLSAAKIDAIAKLRRQKAAPLYKRLMKLNEKDKLSDNPPSEAHLADWIAQAKKLKVVVR